MGPQSADQAEDGGAPRRAGRYVLGRVLGAGGMGVVRASYDPALDREIAVKLIGGLDVGPASDEPDDDGTKRRALAPPTSPRRPTSEAVDDGQLLAEARALARVAHPNIIEVFDVGVCEAGVFIAMELVDGESLRAWNETNHPEWRTAVALHLDAGEALAAAHRVGIVHGDFKPDNVLVSRSGRVKVVDFGLARAIGRFEPPSSDGDLERSEDRPHAVFGTPAYLAPECWAGPQRDASADQFAFFVALFEAIAGHRPFRRVGSLGGLLLQMNDGVDPRALDGFAPPRLVRAIERGLRPDPTRRFPSMRDALVELRAIVAHESGRRSKRRMIAMAVAVALPVLAVTVGTRLWSGWRERTAIAACEAGARAIETEWNDEARAHVREAIVAGDPVAGASTSERVLPWLDAYATDWAALRRSTCVRAATESTVPSAIDHARDRCFGERRAALAALLEVMGLAEQDSARNAVRSAADLPRIAACDDEAWLALQTALPEDPSTRARVEEVLHSLARANQLSGVGQNEKSLEIADAAVASADELDWPALRARARLTRGHALGELGRYSEAEAELESAYFHAGEAADDALRAAIAAQLASVVGSKLARFPDGLAWVRHAETALAAVGGPDTETHARLAIANAAILARSGAVEESIVSAERALAIRTQLFGPDHPSVGSAEFTLGSALAQIDRTTEAVVHIDRAREIFEQTLGPDHIDLARVYHNLGAAALSVEDYAEARPMLERGLAIRMRVLGPDHPDVATSLSVLAYADLGQHRFDEAKRGFERTLAIREAKLGPNHPAVADTLASLGDVALKLGECRKAVLALERGLDISQRERPDDHRAHMRFALNLGDALLECHEHRRARVQYEAALALADVDPSEFARQRERAAEGIAAASVTAN